MHAARAAVSATWCATLGISVLVVQHPLTIAAVGLAVITAGFAARVGRPLLSVIAFALPFALLWALINPFLVRDGLTVFARLGEVPLLGQLDLTLEALLYGARQSLRLLTAIAAFGLLTLAVDPDALLRLFRRVSFRSALAASVATRLVPVLAADSRRMRDAARCRADEGGGAGGRAQLTVLRAVLGGALDRSLNVAATLEVRGYGVAGRPARHRTPWSRHDIAFACSAAAVALMTAGALVAGVAALNPYDLHGGNWAQGAGLGVALATVALLPFCDRRGIEP